MSENTPINDLLINEIPDDFLIDNEVTYKEYQTSNGDAWRVDVWDKLSDDFDLSLSDMASWHDTFAGQGRLWTILRRYYFIAAIYDSKSLQEVEHRRWTFKEIADHLSVPLKLTLTEFDNALDFWRKGKSSAKMNAKMKSASNTTDDSEAPANLPTQLDLYQDINEETITSILTQIGYNHIKEASHRLDIADRAITLKEFFEDRNRRASARQIIGLEVSMYNYEAVLININNQIQRESKELCSNGDAKVFTDTHNKSLEDRLRNTEKALREAAAAHTKIIQALGIQDTDEDHLKTQFTGAISSLTEACRAFQNNEKNYLLDHVFTAKEINWLLAPQGPRPAQYRPDIVLQLIEDLKPENLYNKDYKPNAVTRETTRKLIKIMTAFSASEDNQSGIIKGVDDVSLDDTSAASTELPEDPTIEAMKSISPPPKTTPKKSFHQEDDDCISIN